MKKRILLFLITCLAIVLIVSTLSLSAGAVGYGTAGANDYVYLFDVTVDNACNSKEMDKDAVNELWFSFTYIDKNGYGTEKTDKFDMSWSDGKNNNAEFLSKYFFRDSDDGYDTSFELSLPGKMTKMNILLNMDGGERLAFTINGIYCNGIRINNNTDYVSSAYYDSKAEITCSMGGSVIDVENSEYFESGTSLDLTQKELNSIMNNPGKKSEFEGKIRDQFNAVIDMSVLDRCVSSPDSEINQLLSHRDEESYYKYTFWVNVENPIDLTNADYDEVEKFVIDMYYVDANGCGKSGKYTLDMSYDSGLKRNKNPEILANFQRDGDTGYQTHFDIWLPGLLTNVECTINMRGEKLVVDFEKITLNSLAVNTDRDYVSSIYFDSTAKIPCSVPSPEAVADRQSIGSADYTKLTDQYGAMISKEFFELIKKDPDRYIYHMY